MTLTIARNTPTTSEDTHRINYLNEDNVIDITKTDLQSLKADLDFSEDINFEQEINKINKSVEDFFDAFILKNRNNRITIPFNTSTITDSPRNIIMRGNQEEINAL